MNYPKEKLRNQLIYNSIRNNYIPRNKFKQRGESPIL